MPIAPTYSNLLKLKKELSVAEEGYSLLDEKREILIMELMHNIQGYKDIEEEITEKLQDAYRALEATFVTIGKGKLRTLIGESEEPFIDIRMRSVMGVLVPELLVDVPEEGILVSLESTDENFDQAFFRFKKLVELLAQWAVREVLLWMLGAEINKTEKRVNALSNLFIPNYKKDIKRIEEALEEEEREEFFRRKRMKRKVY